MNVQQGIRAGVYGLLAEAANYATEFSYAPNWSLGAAGAAAIIVDGIGQKAIAAVTKKLGELAPFANKLVTHKFTQLALRAGVDVAAAVAVGVVGFGVAAEVSSVAPFVLLGVAPIVVPKAIEVVKGLLPKSQPKEAVAQ